MTAVPRVRAKTAAMRWQAELDEKSGSLSQRIARFTACCESVTSSDKLARILEIILALGNILNRGTKRAASGFKLSSLTKLSDTKASNKSTTLLHYLAKTVEEKSSELLDFSDSLLAPLDANKAVKVAELRAELRELRAGMAQLEEERAACGEEDAFVQGTDDLHATASKRLSELDEALTSAASAGTKVREYFGEDDAGGEAFECFAVLATFCHAFGKAVGDNRARGGGTSSRGNSARGGGGASSAR